ncbi:unnamed protein product, partial [marine sediment metagenome]
MTNKLDSLATMVDAALAIEKLRVASEVRQSHLALQNRQDPETDELHQHLNDLEDYVDERVASLIESHPAYDWFSCVKGVGKENIAKVVGLMDIEKAEHISSLWKFAGFSVEGGVAPKRRKGGGKLEYNSQLRSMCWRLGSSLIRVKGKFYDYYLEEKDKYYQKYKNRGVQIVPATSLPKKEGKRYEPDDMMSEGHVHNQAMRKMIKLFLACLWLVWRESEKLPVTSPYAIGILEHTSLISPWGMIDKPKEKRKPVNTSEPITESNP